MAISMFKIGHGITRICQGLTRRESLRSAGWGFLACSTSASVAWHQGQLASRSSLAGLTWNEISVAFFQANRA